jgi:hypothetical protein
MKFIIIIITFIVWTTLFFYYVCKSFAVVSFYLLVLTL